MHLKFDGVNDAFEGMVRKIHERTIYTVASPSRVGDVLQIPEPIIVTYNTPKERVLFNKDRDCNPFMNLYEALWMLAGRNDIASIKYYSSAYRQFVDDGDGIANGAYGYRWRRAPICVGSNPRQGSAWEYTQDQLQLIIEHLKAVPTSRRVVLQMWNVNDDLLRIGPENQSRDVCCNTAAYFSLRKEYFDCDEEDDPANKLPKEERFYNYLDMTVTNRSNDIILGMLGANIVHFSMLLEYLANCIGVGVGVYNQFSNNAHVYAERWYPDKWLQSAKSSMQYGDNGWKHVPLVKNQKTFDQEVGLFASLHSQNNNELASDNGWKEPFLNTVAAPMMRAFHYHKQRDYDKALATIDKVVAGDWQYAGRQWIEMRKENYEKKEVKE